MVSDLEGAATVSRKPGKEIRAVFPESEAMA